MMYPLLRRSIRAEKLNTFDPATGLIYSEIICDTSPMSAAWVWATRGMLSDIVTFRSPGPGCATMQEMAIRRIIMHASSLVVESLDAVPWQVAKKLWQMILRQLVFSFVSCEVSANHRSSDLDSLHSWKVFISSYPEDTGAPSLKHRLQVIAKPRMLLNEYYKPITSESFQWITFLTLSDITCSRNDLTQLSLLTNLGTLAIGRGVKAPETGLDDRIIRAWAEAANVTKAFSMLRVLVCRWQKDLTVLSLQYLARIPGLTLFIVEACSVGHKDKVIAKDLGWKYSAGRYLRESIFDGVSAAVSWDTIIRSCFHKENEKHVESLRVEGIEAVNGLPSLHFCIGRVPADITLGPSDNRSLQCFIRPAPQKLQSLTSVTSKRSLSEEETVHNKRKRTIRSVRQHNFEDLIGP
ncbi:hypothetical protein MMC06_002052 [Schaereria dolodes]|nr:hypothetical protein [Schaereria dolodes]